MSRILIVDDEPSVLRALEMYFTDAGFEVSIADNDQRALLLLAEETINIVVTDLIMMTGLDGDKLTGLIKSSYPDMPVIISSSSFNYGKETQEAQRYGADDGHYKNSGPKRLLEKVQALLN